MDFNAKNISKEQKKSHLLWKWLVALPLFVLVYVFFLLNHRYQVIALNPPFYEDGELRVLTWNIHDSGEDYEERQPDIAKLIVEQKPNIVLMNEFYLKKSRTLDSVLRENYPYVVDTWTNVLSGDVLYSQYPIKSYRKLRCDTLTPQSYEFILQIQDQNIRIIGSHMTSTNNQDTKHRYTLKQKSDLKTLPAYFKLYKKGNLKRQNEAILITEYIRETEMPTIVMGDLNDMGGTRPLNILQSEGLKDAWWEGGLGLGFTFKEGWMRLRIDHILYNNHFDLKKIKVIKTELSDHYPVIANFDLRQKGDSEN